MGSFVFVPPSGFFPRYRGAFAMCGSLFVRPPKGRVDAGLRDFRVVGRRLRQLWFVPSLGLGTSRHPSRRKDRIDVLNGGVAASHGGLNGRREADEFAGRACAGILQIDVLGFLNRVRELVDPLLVGRKSRREDRKAPLSGVRSRVRSERSRPHRRRC